MRWTPPSSPRRGTAWQTRVCVQGWGLPTPTCVAFCPRPRRGPRVKGQPLSFCHLQAFHKPNSCLSLTNLELLTPAGKEREERVRDKGFFLRLLRFSLSFATCSSFIYESGCGISLWQV